MEIINTSSLTFEVELELNNGRLDGVWEEITDQLFNVLRGGRERGREEGNKSNRKGSNIISYKFSDVLKKPKKKKILVSYCRIR